MPRHLFDLDLPGVDQAVTEAFELLMHVVRDRMPEGRHLLAVRVRDPRGNVVYLGRMTMNGTRHER